jgi:multidrug efflux system outer membrane protein
MRRRLAAATACCFLFGCAIGPGYKRPEVKPPAAYRNQVGPTRAASLADLPWWKVFQDDALSKLIRESLQANLDLRAAAARVREAHAQAIITRAELFPSVGYLGGFQRTKGSFSFSQPVSTGSTVNAFFGVLNASWEVDLWGRIRRMNEAGQAEYHATEAWRRGVLLSLVSDVAAAYIELRELDQELVITRRTVKSFQKTLDIFQRQYEGGVASKLAPARAEAALADAAAAVPALERQVGAQENLIRLLLGRAPGPVERGAPQVRVATPPEIPPGIPAALLDRRPDVRQAEDNLRAANARVGAAIADFLPRIGLTSFYGQASPELSQITDFRSNLWSLAASFSGPIVNGGREIGQYKARKAQFEEAKLGYEQTVLQALREVSDALLEYRTLEKEEKQREREAKALREAVDLSQSRFLSGLSGYYEVLDAQQQLFPAEIALSQARSRRLLAVVKLYKVLGGGWNFSVEATGAKP